MTSAIPVVLVCGFRGAGKSSVIRNLARRRPQGDLWGVIGPAGTIEPEAKLLHEPVPHGCPCCIGSVTFRAGLVHLIRRAGATHIKRILVEGGPEGHAGATQTQVMRSTAGVLLQVEQVIAVIDPHWIELPLPAARAALEQLVREADAVIANKWDTAGASTRSAFSAWMHSLNRSWQTAVNGAPVDSGQDG
jgi:G3E family GTPase